MSSLHNPKRVVSECEQAHQRWPAYSCCKQGDCDWPGYPNFFAFGFTTSCRKGKPLSVAEIEYQLGVEKRPFGFTLHYGNGYEHMMVVVGYKHYDGKLWLFIHDPASGANQPVTYDYYAGKGKALHGRDYYAVKFTGKPIPAPGPDYCEGSAIPLAFEPMSRTDFSIIEGISSSITEQRLYAQSSKRIVADYNEFLQDAPIPVLPVPRARLDGTFDAKESVPVYFVDLMRVAEANGPVRTDDILIVTEERFFPVTDSGTVVSGAFMSLDGVRVEISRFETPALALTLQEARQRWAAADEFAILRSGVLPDMVLVRNGRQTSIASSADIEQHGLVANEWYTLERVASALRDAARTYLKRGADAVLAPEAP